MSKLKDSQNLFESKIRKFIAKFGVELSDKEISGLLNELEYCCDPDEECDRVFPDSMFNTLVKINKFFKEKYNLEYPIFSKEK
mgnify:CR=1 FL=1